MLKSSLEVGVDVPWVTSWTEEPLLGVRPCATVNGGLAIAQVHNAGFGRPQYSKNHLPRQRLSVARMLCPMCGLPTSPEDRWTQVARWTSVGRLRREGPGTALPQGLSDDQLIVDAGAIAPLHRNCVDLSLARCPHLQANPNVDVRPFPDRWLILPLMIEATQKPESAQGVLRQSTGSSVSVPIVAFLQLCGVTRDSDPKWRRRKDRPALSENQLA